MPRISDRLVSTVKGNMQFLIGLTHIGRVAEPHRHGESSMSHRLTQLAQSFQSLLQCVVSQHTVGMIFSVVLNPIVFQLVTQRHSATVQSGGICCAGKRSGCSRSVSED